MTSINPSLYRRLWRWHFMAGLFVVPFAVTLALTGSLYLFKPQIEAAIDTRIGARASVGQMRTADDLVAAALAAYPGSALVRYEAPLADAGAARVLIRDQDRVERLLWVDRSNGQILHDVAKRDRLLNVVQRLHSSLLAGTIGNRLVELAASLMIILVLSGLYLHWPRGNGWYRAFVPDLRLRGRALWRGLHGSAGLWASLFILGLLLSGLPWTGVWGKAFTELRGAMGWTGPGQEWFVTLQSSPRPEPDVKSDGLKLWSTDDDEGQVRLVSGTPGSKPIALQQILGQVAPEGLPRPIWVQPPRAPNGVWTVRAMPAARHQRQTLHFDQWTGEEVMRIRFDDYHPVEKAMGHGLSFHEGALFGPLNQATGVLTALAIITLALAGTLAWWRRRPSGALGVPPMPTKRRLPTPLIVGGGILLLLLPMAAISVASIWLIDTFARRLGITQIVFEDA